MDMQCRLNLTFESRAYYQLSEFLHLIRGTTLCLHEQRARSQQPLLIMAICSSSRDTQKRIFWFCMSHYGKKLLISFQPLRKANMMSKFHKNWLIIVARRAYQRFQTGFSHPVDPEFQIFQAHDHLRQKVCPQSPCLHSQVAYSLQNVQKTKFTF